MEKGSRTQSVDIAKGILIILPCQMINCFCMYSDYTPLTLEEWVECDCRRHGREDRSNAAQCALDMVSDDFMSNDRNR